MNITKSNDYLNDSLANARRFLYIKNEFHKELAAHHKRMIEVRNSIGEHIALKSFEGGDENKVFKEFTDYCLWNKNCVPVGEFACISLKDGHLYCIQYVAQFEEGVLEMFVGKAHEHN